jgi:hypothetical protein
VSEPTTDSGKQFAGLLNSLARENSADHAKEWIVAIESEAPIAVLRELREEVAGMLTAQFVGDTSNSAFGAYLYREAVLAAIDRRL